MKEVQILQDLFLDLYVYFSNIDQPSEQEAVIQTKLEIKMLSMACRQLMSECREAKTGEENRAIYAKYLEAKSQKEALEKKLTGA